MIENVTYWADENDSRNVRVHVIVQDESGEERVVIGSPAPSDESVLTPMDVTLRIAAGLADFKAAFMATEEIRVAQSEVAITTRAARIEELTALGLSQDTAEVMVPSARPYTATEFKIPTGLENNLAETYRLSDEQVALIIRRGTEDIVLPY